MFQSGANESTGSKLDLFFKTTVARKLGHIRSAPGARGVDAYSIQLPSSCSRAFKRSEKV